MNSDLIELLNLLNESNVRYLIVGGYAVMHHSEPRYTKDLDIWISRDPENAQKVFDCLKKFGAPLTGITVEDFQTKDTVYHMGCAPARVDILMSLVGVEFDDCWNKKELASLGSVKVPFISAEHLIINKKLAGRPQDLMDVEGLTKKITKGK
jgi:Nucleotidyl transferase of unknown function (DUF2204)